MNITTWLQGRKPGESNKLFDLFPPQENPHNPSNPWLNRNIQRRKRFIYVYRLGEDGDLRNEGNGMLSVWALRARSYKTKVEA